MERKWEERRKGGGKNRRMKGEEGERKGKEGKGRERKGKRELRKKRGREKTMQLGDLSAHNTLSLVNMWNLQLSMDGGNQIPDLL